MGNLTGITPLVKGAQQFAKTPGASSVALGKGLASMEVKSRAARALTKPVKSVTGNNPVINKALDIGADYVAPFVPTPKAIKEPRLLLRLVRVLRLLLVLVPDLSKP